MNEKVKFLVIKEDSALGLKNIINNWKYVNEISKTTLFPFFLQPYESLTNHKSISLFQNAIEFKNYIDLNKIGKTELFSIEFTDEELTFLKPWIKNSIYLNSFFYGRNFFSDVTESDLINYCKICALYYKKVFERFKPLEIIDIECDNLLRAVLDIICRRFKIKYTILINTRIDNYAIKAKGVLDPFPLAELKNKLKNIKTPKDFRNIIDKHSYLADEKIFDKKNDQFTILSALQINIKQSFYHLKRIIKSQRLSNKYSVGLKGLLLGFKITYIKWLWFKSYRFLFNKNFVSKRHEKFKYKYYKNEKFFYFPLGQIIEGADPIFSGSYNNDLEALDQAIKSIPVNKKLLIKEHRSMIPERPIYQTKLIDSLNSIFLTGKELIVVNSKINPVRFINDSLGVLSLSGSYLTEAMILKKPVFIFGKPWLRVVSALLGFDPWSQPNALDLFFSESRKFIIPEVISEKIISLSIIYGFPISLYKLKKYGDKNSNINNEKLNLLIKFIND